MSVGYVAGTERDKPFGFDLYNAPAADHRYRIETLGKNDEKRKNFAQTQADSLKWVPGPKYVEMPNWTQNIKGSRGKFLKKARKTFTDDVIDYEKKLPGPNRYTNMQAMKKNMERIPGVYNANDKRIGFTDTSRWHSLQTPTAKYNPSRAQPFVKPRGLASHIIRPQTKEPWQIPKMDGPGPGSYDTPAAIKQA